MQKKWKKTASGVIWTKNWCTIRTFLAMITTATAATTIKTFTFFCSFWSKKVLFFKWMLKKTHRRRFDGCRVKGKLFQCDTVRIVAFLRKPFSGQCEILRQFDTEFILFSSSLTVASPSRPQHTRATIPLSPFLVPAAATLLHRYSPLSNTHTHTNMRDHFALLQVCVPFQLTKMPFNVFKLNNLSQ